MLLCYFILVIKHRYVVFISEDPTNTETFEYFSISAFSSQSIRENISAMRILAIIAASCAIISWFVISLSVNYKMDNLFILINLKDMNEEDEQETEAGDSANASRVSFQIND